MKSCITVKLACFTFILIVFFLSFSLVSAKSPAESNEKRILTKVENVYDNIVSYIDSGTVKTKIEKVEFKTCYIKPNSFLFKWILHTPLISTKTSKEEIFSEFNAVLADGSGVYILYDYKNDSSSELIKVKNLRKAIARSYGVSYGSAGIIPNLFIENLGLKPITALEKPSLLGYEDIRGISCFHIMGKHVRSMTEYHLWIGRDDYLVRKVKRKSKVGVIEIIYDNVAVNIEIPQTVFNLEKIKEDCRNTLPLANEKEVK